MATGLVCLLLYRDFRRNRGSDHDGAPVGPAAPNLARVNDRPVNPLRRLRRPSWADQEPSWAAAKPGLIRAALDRASARPSGGWFVMAASREVRPDRAFGRTVAGRELVAWRDADGTLAVGPGACPHLGAALCDAPVHEGRLVCRWHGMALGAAGRPGWRTLRAHDDGVLAWVRLDDLADGAAHRGARARPAAARRRWAWPPWPP